MGGSIAIVGADIRTMDTAGTRAEAVLVRDGMIECVGPTAEIRPLADAAGIEVLDAAGATVLPGFVDAHTHLELSAFSLARWPQAHTPPLTSLAEVAQVVRQYLAARPGDDFVLVRSSFGMHTKVEEARLFTRAELDAVEPVRPLAVAAGLHVLSLNTPAMKLLGVLEMQDSQERIIHRDAGGQPSGVVTEVFDRIPFVPAQESAAALRAQVPVLATQYGVTTVGSIAWNPHDADTLQSLIDEGLPLRLRSYVHVPRTGSLEDVVAAGVRSADPIPWAGVAGVKVFVDGQHGDGFDAVFDDLKWTQGELDDFVDRATQAGVQVLMHAVSTTAVRMAATAIERATGGAGNPMRHRIEHGADYIEMGDIPRAAEVGALLVTTPQFLLSSEGEAAEPGAFLRSILDAGVPLAGGTDTTGTVPEGASPLYNIACAMNRDGAVRNESLDFDAAASLFTSAAAHAMFEEATRGVIAPGAFGDLVVLDRPVDALSAPTEAFELRVDRTIFAGRVVFERGL